MERQHHLDFERYLDVERGHRSVFSLAVATHRHAVECCPVCREEWEGLAREQAAVRGRLAEDGSILAQPAEPAGDHLGPGDLYLPEAGTFEAQGLDEVKSRKRHRRRKVRQELWELLRLPPEERPGLVRRARKRFRSRALAEELIRASRERVRAEPREAEGLAGLVPRVLARALEDDPPLWATLLSLRAAAHRANAVRIRGDLSAAERQFRRIRQEIATRSVRDPHLIAEVASLEASVALDQRRFGDAEARLSLAHLVAQGLGDRGLILRILLKEAFLQWHLGSLEQTLQIYEQTEGLLSPDDDPYLHLSIVTSRTLALCDLERFGEAEQTLLLHQDVFEQAEDVHTGATLCALRGRIALGLERLDDAAAAFAMARDELLAAGRHYDAALACVDLAEAHLRRGATGDLRKHAARLVRLFQAHGVEREALAVMRLLTRAVAADKLTVAFLRKLRQRLESECQTSHPPTW